MTINSYQLAVEYLGTKQDRPYTHGRATRVQKRDNGIAIKYHYTDVVLFTPEYIELNSGGYRTLTTKSRMCESLPNSAVYQERGIWYVARNWADKNRQIFFDGIRLNYAGEVLNPIDEKLESERINKLIKQIKAYADKFIAALNAGEIGVPGSGDCWFCVMKTADGKTLGDSVNDKDHLKAHLEEFYFVPSLLLNAVLEYGSRAEYDYVKSKMQKQVPLWGDMSREVKKRLIAYMKNRLGVAG